MTDRELLERAAKAAGLPHKWIPMLGKMLHIIDAGNSEDWNPLTDDGDALRLAVKLNIFNTRGPGYEWPVAELFEHHKDNPYAATRRAIVRAAAAMAE
jgi:hypothetical protein